MTKQILPDEKNGVCKQLFFAFTLFTNFKIKSKHLNNHEWEWQLSSDTSAFMLAACISSSWKAGTESPMLGLHKRPGPNPRQELKCAEKIYIPALSWFSMLKLLRKLPEKAMESLTLNTAWIQPEGRNTVFPD